MLSKFRKRVVTCTRCGEAVLSAELLGGATIELDIKDLLAIDFPTWPPREGLDGLVMYVEDDLVATVTLADKREIMNRRHVCSPTREGA